MHTASYMFSFVSFFIYPPISAKFSSFLRALLRWTFILSTITFSAKFISNDTLSLKSLYLLTAQIQDKLNLAFQRPMYCHRVIHITASSFLAEYSRSTGQFCIAEELRRIRKKTVQYYKKLLHCTNKSSTLKCQLQNLWLLRGCIFKDLVSGNSKFNFLRIFIVVKYLANCLLFCLFSLVLTYLFTAVLTVSLYFVYQFLGYFTTIMKEKKKLGNKLILN